MAELLQTYAELVRDADGVEYTVHAYGEARPDGNWEGWLEFHPAAGAVRRTNRETTQPNRDALAYWASGLEPLYFDGAFARAS
jgi:hypothetical protein